MKLPSFLVSCLLAFLGGHMVNYTIIFLALEWFNSHQLAGIGYALCFAPPIILGWFAGIYCDRYSPRKVILVAQNSYLISLLVIGYAFTINIESRDTLLLIAAFISGIGWSFVAPARYSALQYYVDKDKLIKASILLNLMVMTGFGLAPMILKWLLSHWQWSVVFISAGSLLLISSLLLIPLTFPFNSKPLGSSKAELIEGLSFIKNNTEIRHLLLISACAYLLMGPMQVLLPSVADKTLKLSEIAQGNYLSLVAFSLIIGGLLAMKLRQIPYYGKFIFLGIAIAAAGIGTLSLISNLVISIVMLIVASIAGGIAISLIVAGLQHYSPPEKKGRIMATYTIIGQFFPAVSGLISGIIASNTSYVTALPIFSIVIVGALLSCLIPAKQLFNTQSIDKTGEP